MQPPFPMWYNLDEICEYHSGVLGHLIEICKIFKYQVPKMVCKRQVEFVNDGFIDHIVTGSSQT